MRHRGGGEPREARLHSPDRRTCARSTREPLRDAVGYCPTTASRPPRAPRRCRLVDASPRLATRSRRRGCRRGHAGAGVARDGQRAGGMGGDAAGPALRRAQVPSAPVSSRAALRAAGSSRQLFTQLGPPAPRRARPRATGLGDAGSSDCPAPPRATGSAATGLRALALSTATAPSATVAAAPSSRTAPRGQLLSDRLFGDGILERRLLSDRSSGRGASSRHVHRPRTQRARFELGSSTKQLGPARLQTASSTRYRRKRPLRDARRTRVSPAPPRQGRPRGGPRSTDVAPGDGSASVVDSGVDLLRQSRDAPHRGHAACGGWTTPKPSTARRCAQARGCPDQAVRTAWGRGGRRRRVG
jgi:hypothetical protein